jgi:hypothetical protein
MRVLASGSVVIEPVMSMADVTELLIDRGTLWKALAKQAVNRRKIRLSQHRFDDWDGGRRSGRSPID